MLFLNLTIESIISFIIDVKDYRFSISIFDTSISLRINVYFGFNIII
ncbi:Uncharacterised protein [Mycobacterium tuberculosis]|uniref:Uncharacterized protein n=1 Tax=Mycobacterium tuberculosis TaxID=1773 RepID=A0A655AT35_MYCTX|nr:Uncharacterised protein [Mycobacterium tuberculosis]